jgi:type II secretory pathway pseudopilin PulG
MRPFLSHRFHRGFGLLEVILVFALVIGAAGVVFTVFQSTQPSADSSRATSSLTLLSANIKGAYAAGGDYSTISVSGLIKNNLVPQDLLTPAGTALIGVWQQPILVQPTADNHHVTIVYEGIPQVACVKFILGAAPYFPTVSLGSSPTDPGTVIRTNNGPISTAAVVTTCSTNAQSVASFTTN